MPVPANLIQQSSTTTGTGDFTLSAVNGRQEFQTAFGTGVPTDVFDYFIMSQSAVEWERGTGHMSDATTLVRDTVLQNSLGTTALISFTAGTKDVVNDIPAAQQAMLTGPQSPLEFIGIAFSDEFTAIAAGTKQATYRMPYALTLSEVRCSLTAAQASGNIFTVDINEDGVSILSTKLTIDNTEKTSVTAATPPVISDTALADDAEITVDVDQIGDGTAAGGKIYLIGRQA